MPFPARVRWNACHPGRTGLLSSQRAPVSSGRLTVLAPLRKRAIDPTHNALGAPERPGPGRPEPHRTVSR